MQKPNPQKKTLIVSIEILIAIVQFLQGRNTYSGLYANWVNSYFFDILIPFGFYFLLCLVLRQWLIKGGLVFGAAVCAEMLQLLGLSVFGRTFDPVDIVMYGVGILLAVLLDRLVFPRLFRFWKVEAA